jgi:hypothetical protein
MPVDPNTVLVSGLLLARSSARELFAAQPPPAPSSTRNILSYVPRGSSRSRRRSTSSCSSSSSASSSFDLIQVTSLAATRPIPWSITLSPYTTLPTYLPTLPFLQLLSLALYLFLPSLSRLFAFYSLLFSFCFFFFFHYFFFLLDFSLCCCLSTFASSSFASSHPGLAR